MTATTTNLDASRYRFIPGVSKVSDIDLDENIVHDQNGVRITEAMCEQWADEAEAAEAQRSRGLIPGGKSLSGDGKHSPTIAVVLPEAVHARVKEAAANAGMSTSRWTRKLIERELAEA